MNKKLLALLLAILMVAVSACAMADTLQGDNATTGAQTEHSFTVTKNYQNVANSETSVIKPELTFGFTVTATNGGPAISVDSCAFTGDDADETSLTKLLTIPTVGSNEGQYPEYPAEYTYTITETIPTTQVQGISYDTKQYYLKVTVVNTAAAGATPAYDTIINLRENNATGDKKANAEFSNTYSAGSLTVSKKLAGNGAFSDDEFTVTISFAAESGKTIASDTITKPSDAVYNANTGVYTVVLGHGDEVTFTNVPAGTTYTVSEDPNVYKAGTNEIERAYVQTLDAGSATLTGTIVVNNETDVALVNTRDLGVIDTGVNNDSTPYILLMALVAIMALAFVAKKRSVRE